METFEEYLGKMVGTVNDAHECLGLLQSALSHNSAGPLKLCREKVASIKKEESELTGKITRFAQENHALRMYLSAPPLLLRIADHIEKLTEIVGKKINEDILFSDRAISELTILFQKLRETLKSASDLLATKNPVLVRHIRECEEDVVKKALEFATLHEDRLIEGLCLPVSAPLYLNMLNSIRCIAWDANEIAMKFLPDQG